MRPWTHKLVCEDHAMEFLGWTWLNNKRPLSTRGGYRNSNTSVSRSSLRFGQTALFTLCMVVAVLQANELHMSPWLRWPAMISVVRYKNVVVSIHYNPERIPQRVCFPIFLYFVCVFVISLLFVSGIFLFCLCLGRTQTKENIERKNSELFLLEKIP